MGLESSESSAIKIYYTKIFLLLYCLHIMVQVRRGFPYEFKSLGQRLIGDTREKTADTLYYNAFTEDLFYWDNDLDNDTERLLKLNSNSSFFSGLKELEMESRIRPLLHRYADFDFTINYENSVISFFKEVLIFGTTQRIDNIKISRGEENIFVWCFFLAIVQLIVDKVESYNWVKYIYVDDPISSLA